MVNGFAEITDYLRTLAELVEQELERLIPENIAEDNPLKAAARYSLLGGGKRLRPILALTAFLAFDSSGKDLSYALTPACALEMVHTYSLIHDDLPCMDDDDFRRGKPSLHKQFNEALAVLAGDYLLTNAFEVLALAPHVTESQKLKLITSLAQASGGEGMVAGQTLDIEAEGKAIDIDSLQAIHKKKTGALIAASLEFGAILADASAAAQSLLRQFGEKIGLAFQVIDDILDVTASEKKHGKAGSSDAANNKTTYVTLLGIERSKRYAEELYSHALEILEKLPGDTSWLAKLAAFILKRNH
jgi:geranylgeranyl diphosphate synthase, type II